MFDFFKKQRRKKVLSKPFPPSWLEILKTKFPLFNKLPEEGRETLKSKMQVFITEKSYSGCQGFEVDDEVRVLVAAQACLLLIGNNQREYPKLKSIVIFPRQYISRSERISKHGIITKDEQMVLGQSWERGVVSLSWQSTKSGASNMFDGRNVVIHEFAHQLDQEDGAADGAPILRNRGRYTAWQTVLSKEYQRLRDKVDRGRKTVMDKYGATHPAEFFAVASECFFEKPKQLKKRRPKLYQELRTFYGQDPVEYH